MKLEGNETYGIFGLPRSGTTITSKIFHNTINCTAYSEPIRGINHDRFKDLNEFGELTSVETTTDDFLDKVRNIPGNCFVKETFSNIRNSTNKDILRLATLDNVIFMMREPKALYSAWREIKLKQDTTKKERFKFNVGQFINIYNDYLKFYRTVSKVRPTTLMYYEDLCYASYFNERGLSAYLNSLFKTNKFSGNLGLLNTEPITSMGDHKSRGKNMVSTPRTHYSNLEDFEIQLIDNLILGKHEDLMDKKYKGDMKIHGYEGSKLSIVKIIKYNTDLGLKESKMFVDGDTFSLSLELNRHQIKQFEYELKSVNADYDMGLISKVREDSLKILLKDG